MAAPSSGLTRQLYLQPPPAPQTGFSGLQQYGFTTVQHL
jgi:hypothetical protein